MSTKKPVKRKPNKRVRRKFTPAEKRKVVGYALKTSLKEASEKFDVHPTLIARWRDAGFKAPATKKNRRVRRKTAAPAEVVAVDAELNKEVRELRAENDRLKEVAIKLLLAAG